MNWNSRSMIALGGGFLESAYKVQYKAEESDVGLVKFALDNEFDIVLWMIEY